MLELDYSKIREYGRLDFLAKQLVEGFITGLHKSPFHGFSVEFAEHRLYNPGESTRHIDWKVYNKTDRLYVKNYEEETNLRCHILLDVSSSMYYPHKSRAKLTFSILAAATLANMLQRQRDAVALVSFSDKIESQTQCKSTNANLQSIYRELEKILSREPANKQTAVSDTLHLIADKIHKRSLVVIFSDMFDDIENLENTFSALQHLKHNKHEVLLFHVLDKDTELEFDFADGPHEFIDLETNERQKLNPAQVREQYTQTIKHFYQELKIKCGQYKIDLIEADIKNGFEPIMNAFLAKRAKMH